MKHCKWANYVVMAFFLLTFIPFFVHSQNVLQIEKRHTKVMLKYTTGDDVTFKLKQSDQWITSTLNEINYDQQIIRFTNLTVVLDSIAAIRSHKPLVPPALGGALWRSGLVALANVAMYGIVFQPANFKEFAYFFGGVTLSGVGLSQLSKKNRIYPIGKKYNLRLLDLNFYIPAVGG
jgi:hypothetical protein